MVVALDHLAVARIAVVSLESQQVSWHIVETALIVHAERAAAVEGQGSWVPANVRAEEMEYAGEEGSDPLGSTVAGEAEVDNFAVVREMLVVEKAEEDSSSPALEEGSRIGPEESSEAVVHIVVGRLE
jgi:hypothetical protein